MLILKEKQTNKQNQQQEGKKIIRLHEIVVLVILCSVAQEKFAYGPFPHPSMELFQLKLINATQVSNACNKVQNSC